MPNKPNPIVQAFQAGVNPYTGQASSNAITRELYRPRFESTGISGIQPLGKWDNHFRLGMNQEANRGFNQPFYSKLMNGILSRGLSIGTKVMQGVGHTAGIIKAISTGDLNAIWDNTLAKKMSEADEALRQYFPVHKSRTYQEGNLLAKMGTAEFWADDLFDGVAFLASAYVPGAIIGKVGKGVSALTAGTKFGNWMAKTGAGTHAMYAATTIYNTASEAGFEAKEVYDRILEELKHKQGDAYNEDEAKKTAGEAAARVFRANSLALLASNYVQTRMMFGNNFSTTSRKLREAAHSNKDLGKAVKDFVSIRGEVAGGIAAEGLWEENIQNSIQRYEDRLLAGFDESMATSYSQGMLMGASGFLKTFTPFVKAPKGGSEEDQAATAVFLGALLGGGMGLASGIRDTKQTLKALTEERSRWNKVKDLHAKAKRLMIDHALIGLTPQGTINPDVAGTEESSDGTPPKAGGAVTAYTKEDGSVTLDPQGMTFAFLRYARDKALVENHMTAAAVSDPLFHQFNLEMGLASYAWNLKSIPNLSKEDIDDLLKYDLEMSLNEGEKQVYGDNYLGDNIAKIREYLEDYETAVSKLGSLDDFSDGKTDRDFSNMMRRTYMYQLAKNKALTKLQDLATKDQTKELIAGMLEDGNQTLDMLVNNRDIFKEAFEEEVLAGSKLQSDILNKKIAIEAARVEDPKADISELKAELNALQYQLEELVGVDNYYRENIFESTEYFSTSFAPLDLRLATKGTYSATTATSPMSLREQFFTSKAMDNLFNEQMAEELATDAQTDEESDPRMLIGLLTSNDNRLLSDELTGAMDDRVSQIATETVPVNDQLVEIEGALADAVAYKSDLEEDPESANPNMLNSKVKPYWDKVTGSPTAINDITANLDAVIKSLGDAANLLKVKLSQSSAIQKAYQNYKQKQQQIKDSRKDATNANNRKQLTDFMRYEFFKQKTEPIRRAIADFESDPDSFLDNVLPFIGYLKNLKAMFEGRTNMKAYRNKILSEIDSMLEKLALAKEAADKNKDKRYAIQKRAADSREKSLIWLAHGNDEDSALLQLAREELTPDVYTALLKSIQDGEPVREQLEVLLNLLAQRLPADKKDNLLRNFNERMFELTNQMLERIKQNYPNLRDSLGLLTVRTIGNAQMSIYTLNPAKFISSVIELAFPEVATEIQNGEVTPFYRYFLSKDIHRLVEEVNQSNKYSAAQKALLNDLYDLHSKVHTTRIAYTGVSTTVKIQDVIEAEFEALTAEKKLYPTAQQAMSFRDVTLSVGSMTTLGAGGNVVLVEGIYGSGKTKLVGERAVKVLAKAAGVQVKDLIVASGHSLESAANIANAIGSNSVSVESLVSNQANLTEGQVLVLDEVFAVPNESVQKIVANMAARNVRIIALGDPSQNRYDADPVLLSTRLLNVHTAEPITIVLRTNNPAITNLASQFQYNTRSVDVAYGEATHSTTDRTAASKGIFSGPAADIQSMLATSSPNATKLIIVNDEMGVARYTPLTTQFSNLKVVTYHKAQGLEADEVYIDLDPSGANMKGQPFASAFEFNSAMATSISRAKELVFVTNQLNMSVQSEIVTNLDERVADLSDEFAKYKKDYEESLDRYRQAVQDMFGESIQLPEIPAQRPESTQDTANTVEENEPEPGEDSATHTTGRTDVQTEAQRVEEEQETAEDTNEPLDSNLIALKFPQSDNIWHADKESRDVEGELSFVKPGAHSRIIKFNSGKGEMWGVAALVRADDNGNKYKIAAVISQQDTALNHPFMQNLPSQAAGVPTLTLGSINQVISEDDVIKHTIVSGIKIHDATINQIRYDSERREGNILKGIMSLLYNGIYNDVTKPLFKWFNIAGQMQSSKIFEGDEPIVTFEVFTRSDIRKKTGHGRNLKPGMPYLVVYMPTEGKGRRASAPMYIRLNPPRLHKNDPDFAHLRSLFDAYVAFHTIVKQANPDFLSYEEFFNSDLFDEVLRAYNQTYKLDENYNMVQDMSHVDIAEQLGVPEEAVKHLDIMYKQLYGIGSVIQRVTLEQYNEMKKNDNDDLLIKWHQQSEGSEYGFIVKKKTTGARSGVEFKTTRAIVRNEGPASKAWVRLGKANETLGDKKVRIEKTVEERSAITGQTQKVTVTQIKALLGSHGSVTRLYEPSRQLALAIHDSLSEIREDALEAGLIQMNGAEERNLTLSMELLWRKANVTMDESDLEELWEEFYKIVDTGIIPGLTLESLNQFGQDLVTKPISILDIQSIVGDANFDAGGYHKGSPAYGNRYVNSGVRIVNRNQERYYLHAGRRIDLSTSEGRRQFNTAGFSTRLSSVNSSSVVIDVSGSTVPQTIQRAQRAADIQRMIDYLNSPARSVRMEVNPNWSDAQIRAAYNMVVATEANSTDNFNANGLFFASTTKGKPITEDEARALVKKLLPGYEVEGAATQLMFLNHMLMQQYAKPNEDIWGRVHNALMSIRSDNGIVYDQVVRHEAFHVVWKYLLTDAQRGQIATSLEKMLGRKLSSSQRSEALAELFQAYEEKRPTMRWIVRKFINDLANLVNLTAFHGTRIETLFRQIENGEFSQKITSDGMDKPSHLKFALDNFGSLSAYRQAKQFLRGLINNYIKSTTEGGGQVTEDGTALPVTRREMFQKLYDDIVMGLEAHRQNLRSLNSKTSTLQQRFNSNSNPSVELQAQLQDALSQQLAATNLVKAFGYMLKTNVRTKNPIFYELIEAIYPSISARDLEELDFEDLEAYEGLEEDMDAEELRTLASLKDITEGIVAETQDAASINWETKQSDALKDFTSFIPVLDEAAYSRGEWEETGKYVNPRYAYYRMLQLLVHLDLNDLNTIQDQFNWLVEQENFNALTASVYYSLRKLIGQVTDITPNTSQGFFIARPIELKSEPDYYFFSGGAEYNTLANAYSMTYEQAKRLAETNSDIRLIKAPNNRLADLFTKVNEQTGISAAQFSELFEHAEAVNKLATIRAYMGSMKDTEYYISQLTRSFEKNSSSMVRARSIGLGASARSILRQKFTELHNQKQLKNNSIISQMITAFESEDQIKIDQAFKRFVSSEFLNMPYLFSGTSRNTTKRVKDDLANLLKSINTIPSEGKVVVRSGETQYFVNESNELEELREDPVQAWLEDNSSRLNKLIDIVIYNSPQLRNNTIIGGKKNRIFKFHLSNAINDRLGALMRFHDQREAGAKVQELPKALRQLSKNNIFLNGINRIYEVAELDSFKEKRFKAETTTSWLRSTYRHFMLNQLSNGFIAQVSNTTSKFQYFQFLYMQSNKPRPVMAKVDLLATGLVTGKVDDATKVVSTPKYRNALMSMLFDQLNAPDFRERIKDFNPAFVNAQVFAKVLQDFDTINEDTYDAILDAVDKELSREAYEFTKELVQNQIEIRGTDRLNSMVRNFTNLDNLMKTLSEFQNREKALTKEDWYGIGQDSLVYQDNKWKYQHTVDQLFPIIDLFFKNNYVNSYFLTQAAAGHSAFFKNGKNQVKRMSGPAGPGHTGFVHPVYGMRKNYKAIVVGDVNVSQANVLEMVAKAAFGVTDLENLTEAQQSEIDRLRNFFDVSGFDSTDAQGYMTPERAAELRRGLGRDFKLASVTKPMYYGSRTVNDNNNNPYEVPTYVKMSVVELTDDLVNQFPLLRNMRLRMYEQGADELYFASAVKVGLPTNRLSVEQFMAGEQAPSDSVMTLNNSEYRIQLNPRAAVDKSVALFTQLIYFLNVLDVNKTTADNVYTAISYIFEQGLEEFNKKLEFSSIRSILKQAFNRNQEDAPLAEKLSAGLSIDNPIFERKGVIRLASLLEKMTTAIRLPGAKLVLQSAYNTSDYYDSVRDRLDRSNNPLEFFKTESGQLVAEMIIPHGLLPKEIEDLIRIGDNVFDLPHLLGFRIPSTELHSAVAIKVVGFYDSKGTNVVIAPDLLVALHGSDFDVDSLFVIKRPTFKRDLTTSLNTELDEMIALQKEAIEILNTEVMSDGLAATSIRTQQAVAKIREMLVDKLFTSPADDELTLEQLNSVNLDEFNAEQDKLYKQFIQRYKLPDQVKSRKTYAKAAGVAWNVKENQWQITSSQIWALTTFEQEFDAIVSKLEPEAALQFSKLHKTLKSLIDNMQKAMISPGAVIGREGDPIGYKYEDGIIRFDISYDAELVDEIVRLENAIETAKNAKFFSLARILNKQLLNVISIKSEFYKGLILEEMLKTITKPENAMRMMTPIAKRIWSDEIDFLRENNFIQEKELDLSNIRDAWDAAKSVSDGAILTGVFANAIKVLAYMVRAGGNTTTAGLLKNYHKTLSKYEKNVNELERKYKKPISEIEEILRTTTDESEKLDNIALKELSDNLADIRIKFLKHIEEVGSTDSNEPWIHALLGFAYTTKEDEATPTLFNSMKQHEMVTGRPIWDLLDALVNVAIDNVKDQYLPSLNATTDTANALAALISLGFPARDAILLLNQPIIKLITKSNTPITGKTIAERAETLSRAIRKKLGESGYDSNLVLSYKDLMFMLREGAENYEDMDTKQLNIAYQMLSVFDKARRLGDDIRDMAVMLNLIREQPVTFDQIEEVIEVVDSIGTMVGDVDRVYNNLHKKTLKEYRKELSESNIGMVTKSNFGFQIPMFFKQNPHVVSSIRIMYYLKDLVEKRFYIHSPRFRNFIDELNLPLRLDASNAGRSRTMLRREAFRYLMTQALEEDFRDVTHSVMRGFGKPLTFYGVDGWSQKFIDTVSKVQQAVSNYAAENPDFKGNFFLDSISRERYGIRHTLRLANATSLEFEDIYELQQDFELLRYVDVAPDGKVTVNFGTGELAQSYNPQTGYTKFQEDFVTYAALNYGFNYAVSNYAGVLPAKVFLPLDKQFQAVLKRFKSDSKYRDAIRYHMKYELLRENADKITTYINKNKYGITLEEGEEAVRQEITIKGKTVKVSDRAGSVTIDGKKIYYDRAYTNPVKADERTFDDATKFPNFITGGSLENPYVLRRISNTLNDKVYYQRLGPGTGTYEKMSQEFMDLRNKENLYDPSFATFHVKDHNSHILYTSRNLSAFVESKEPVRLVNVEDKSWSQVRFVTLKEQSADKRGYIVEDYSELPTLTMLTNIPSIFQTNSSLYVIKDSDQNELGGIEVSNVNDRVIRTAPALSELKDMTSPEVKEYLKARNYTAESIERNDCKTN